MNRRSFKFTPWDRDNRIRRKLNELINFRGTATTRNEALMKLYDERDKRIREIQAEYESLINDITARPPLDPLLGDQNAKP